MTAEERATHLGSAHAILDEVASSFREEFIDTPEDTPPDIVASLVCCSVLSSFLRGPYEFPPYLTLKKLLSGVGEIVASTKSPRGVPYGEEVNFRQN